MKRSALVITLALALAGPARAMSLKELLDASEQQNLDRRISREQLERAAAEERQAWSALFPALTAQAGWTHNQYETRIPLPTGEVALVTPFDQLDGTLRVELPLVDSGRWLRAGAADSAGAAAAFRDEASRDAVRRQVVTTFYGYAASLAVRESARRSLGVAQAQHQLQQVRERAGAATQLEVMRARAEVQRNLQVVADAEALVAISRRALRTLTGIEVDEQAVLPRDDFSAEGTLEDLEARAGELPVVKAAEKDAEVAGRLATASNLAFVPSVSGQFTERLSNAGGLNGRERYYTAGIGLSWRMDGPTIFAPGVQGAQRRIAVLGAERQRIAARDQIHTDWRRLQAAMEKVTAAGAQVEASQKAAQVARDRYDAGAATQLEVIQAERDLFAAEVNQIQGRSELASSHASLRISAGIPLQLD
jgi:outer membrane protein TolC